MEASQSRRDVEARHEQSLSELQAQTSGLLYVLSRVEATRLLYLEHLPRYGQCQLFVFLCL